MGGAMAEGFSRSRGIAPSDITVSGPHIEKLERFSAQGMNTTTDNCAAAGSADIVVMAVKPWLAETVAKELKPVLGLNRQILLSVCAGISAAELTEWLGEGVELFLVIPNLAISVGQSMTFVVNVNGSEKSRQKVERLLEGTGKVIFTNEKLLQAGTALASCGTAYALRYVEAAIQGGVELGLSEEDAVEAVLQTVSGAIDLLKSSGQRPEAIIDKVTTPGGMTLRGLSAMERSGFTKSVIDGLKA